MNSEPNRNNSTDNYAKWEREKTRYYTIIQWIFIFSKLLAPELIDDRNLETENAQKKEKHFQRSQIKIIKPRLPDDLEQCTTEFWTAACVCECVVAYISKVSLCANFPVPERKSSSI